MSHYRKNEEKASHGQKCVRSLLPTNYGATWIIYYRRPLDRNRAKQTYLISNMGWTARDTIKEGRHEQTVRSRSGVAASHLAPLSTH
jgi:hypothetical protein